MYCYIRFDESEDEQKYSGNQAAKNDIWYECKVCLKILHTYYHPDHFKVLGVLLSEKCLTVFYNSFRRYSSHSFDPNRITYATKN